MTSSSEVTTTIRTGLITNDMGGYTFVNELTVWVRTGAETYAGDRRLWFPYATMYFNKVAITSNDYRNYEINSRGATVVPTYPGMDYVEASYNDNPDTLFAQDTVSGITVDLVSLRNWHNIDIPCVSGATSAILKIGQAGWPASKMMTFYASFDPKTIVNGIRVIQRARWYDGTTTPLEEIGFDASDWKTQCSDPAYRVTHGSPVEWALYFKYKLDGYWMDVEGWLTGTSVWQWFY
ncbi:MAG: hypothetical protein JXR39_11600 [Marinilabiliaceae bacterium]|nr:hypothetical protein [Marinilabiliaceae bacterium]